VINNDDTFIVEMEYSMVNQALPEDVAGADGPAAASPAASPTPLLRSPTPASVEAARNDNQVVELVDPLAVQEEDLDADHGEDGPLCLRVIYDILRPVQPQGLARCVLEQELNVVSSDEPNTFDEAEQDPCWRGAMLEEMQSIEENGTWYLADLPAGHKAIGLKWIFKVKRNEGGEIVKHKARLVVKGRADALTMTRCSCRWHGLIRRDSS
jgi:hypothetical protein